MKSGLDYSVAYCGIQMAFQCNSPDSQRPLSMFQVSETNSQH